MEPLRAGDPQQLGGYRLRARLGSGGMGQVYLGFSQAGRAVAVKVVHPELARDEGFRSRFRREVAAARRVGGGCTAPVLDAGVDDASPWLATAFVPGPSLADVVAATGPLAEGSAWRLAGGLVEALTTIHACGIVHRDLKPANILMAADGPRVIDFGISRARESTTVTASGLVIGTPGFMSPEQAEGLPAGPPSDVFSLGAVLAFAATGTEPFGEGLLAAIMYRLVHREPDLADLPAPLRDLVLGCLAKRPDDRPALSRLMEIISARLAAEPGTSPTSFWPGTVAEHIRAYQTDLSAQARVVTPAGADGQAPLPSGVDRHSATTSTSPRLPADPVGPPRPEGVSRPVPPYRRPGTGLTRRRLILGLAGVSVLGTGTIWGLEEATKGSGRTASQTSSPPSFPRSAAVSWTFHAQDWVKSAAADGDFVYVAGIPTTVGTAGGGVYALRASNGGGLWNYTPGITARPVAVADGVVYVTDPSGRASALWAGDGSRRWRSVPGSPCVVSGGVVYGTDGTSVFALHVRDGSRIWRYTGAEPSPPVTGPPIAVADGVVYCTGKFGVFALQASNGRPLWGFSKQPLASGPVQAGSVICVGGDDGTLYALRA